MAHPFTSPFPPPLAPTAVPLPPAAFLTSNQVLSAPPPASIPAPAAAYTVPPPMVFPTSGAPARTHPQVADLPFYLPPQPHINFSYQAPPPINTTFLEPGTPTHAAQVSSPTHFFPEADAEQERRLKRMEETIGALQANDARPDARYGDCSLFPGMRLPPKFKIPEFKTYGGTTDPRHHLRHYRGKMLQRIDSNRLTFNAVRPPNVQDNPLPDHRPSSGPSINMISICASRRNEDMRDNPLPFVINYTPEEPTVGFAGHMASSAPFVVDIPAREPYTDSKVPWTYEGSIGRVEKQFSVMGVTRSGRVYENSTIIDKGKAPATEVGAVPESSPFPSKKVTEEEAEAFMKVIKASEYKVVEQMAKSPAHISLLALLLGSEPHREALLRVLTAAQVPKETPPDRIEETVGSIFSNTISFSDDELPFEGWSHSRALHIVCKCNNYIIGRVMIDNGSALNVCPVTTLKQMNVDLNQVRPSKTAVRALNGSLREVNGEIDLLIDVGSCSFSITFQVLDISNAFSLLLGRPWIHSAGAIPSSLHQRLKFIVEEKLITVKGEEDYTIYKETAVPYISVGNDENLPFHSFKTISVIRDYGEIRPSRTDRMIGRVLLRNNYVPGTGLGARGKGISRPIEVEEYKHRRGLGFRLSCHEIIEARRGHHLHHLAAHYGRLNRGIPVPPVISFLPRAFAHHWGHP
ncbi:uncharacterized protein LOC116205712 [Punica granatum]|uniref:Uncharacterized protein LOC116205712 n=1 Tax=Punica granatum TaxID=22663 RepID=A0A6P8DAN6_PUNGR|nr:uncharacterized protein LOC116205712 [Punica granatum]